MQLLTELSHKTVFQSEILKPPVFMILMISKNNKSNCFVVRKS